MRKIRDLRLAVATLALLLVACTPGLDWRELKSAEGHFSAVMPGKMLFEARPLSGAPGVTMYLWSARAGNSLFGVGYADYPAADAGILERTRDALIANLRGRVIEDTPLRRNGFVGRTLVAEAGDTALRAQWLIAGGRLYQLAVLGPKTAIAAADLDLFFSSFRPLDAVR
jgi:hypothetical protein